MKESEGHLRPSGVFLFYKFQNKRKEGVAFFLFQRLPEKIRQANRKNEKNAKKVLFASFFRARSCSSLGKEQANISIPELPLRYTDVGLRPFVYNVVGGSDSKSP